jgi:Protein of unknown function (DUF1638)
MTRPVLVLACGALAHEIQHLKTVNGWSHMTLKCLDAQLHNRPGLIAAQLERKIEQYRDEYESIFVAYADCGTGGEIDKLLETHGIERLPGAHCYSTFAGEAQFQQIAESEPGTFYLTDFLARHFDRLIVKGLKLDLHPELHQAFFGNYRRVVYLSQQLDQHLLLHARSAASFLNLEFEHLHCGYGELETSLRSQVIAAG